MVSDGELLERFLGGDESAFESLVIRHEMSVRKLVSGLLRDPGTAEDVAQEAFLRVYRHAPSLEQPEAFRAWLYRIAINSARDALRRRQRRREVSLEDIEQPARAVPGTVEDLAAARELRRDMTQALAEMRDEHRAPFVLREVEGLTYKEIASVLGWPLGTVQVRIHRARQELRVLLAKHGKRG